MKKLITLLTSITIAVSFTACSNDSKSSSSETPPVDVSSHYSTTTPTKSKDTQVTSKVTEKNSENSSPHRENTTEVNVKNGTVDIADVIHYFHNYGVPYYKSNMNFYEYDKAVVKGTDGKTYLINEDGQALSILNDDIEECIYVNGYDLSPNLLCYTEKEFAGHDQHFQLYTIRDNNNNVIFDEDDNIITPISKNGFMITFDVVDQLSGITENYKIIDINGNTVCELGEGWFDGVGYLGDDIFYYHWEGREGSSVLIDAKSKKVLDLSTFQYNGNNKNLKLKDCIEFGGVYYNKDLSGQYISFNECSDYTSVIDSGYGLPDDLPLANIRFWDKNTIYDFEGNPLKEISDGGILHMIYYDGVYYIISTNNFIYTLDDNFNYITEPQKMERPRFVGLTNSGVVFNDWHLIDKNLDDIDLSIPTDEYLVMGDYVYYTYNSKKIIKNYITGKTIDKIIIGDNSNSNNSSKPSANEVSKSESINLCADSSNWTNWSSEENGCAANLKVLSDGAALEITKSHGSGGEQTYYYYNMLKYENITLEKNATYLLEFDIEATGDIDFGYGVQKNYDPYTLYIGDVLCASSDVSHYSFEFTMTESDNNAAIGFNLNCPNVAVPYTVSIHNLTLTRIS